jgi:uncharacterized OB-fold protein
MSAIRAEVDREIPGRALPLVCIDNQPFYDGCARGELWLQRCVDTGQFQFYPRPCSVFTGGAVEWVRAAGLGHVHTFSIIRRNYPEPYFAALTPYVVAIIDLDEGVRMMSNVTRCPPDDVRIGMRVAAHFACVHAKTQLFLPFWHPVAA